MRSLPFLLFLAGTLSLAAAAQARMPGQPYSFPAPDLEALLPFTRAESKAFREAGVREIEIVHQDGSVSMCKLNAEGLLDSFTEVEVRNDLEVHIARGVFRYDREGRLLIRRYADDRLSVVDSLAYDAQGRLSHYLSTRRDRSVKNGPTDTLWHLVVQDPDSQRVLLRDLSTPDERLFELDAQGRIVHVRTGSRTDSLSVDTLQDGRVMHRCWYRTDSADFRLGQEMEWVDGRLRTETVLELGDDGRLAYRKHFHHDPDGRLRRIERDDLHQDKELYTYYENGLVMEQITVTRLHVWVKRFRYAYGS